ncbi:tape measure protein [Paraburkholderia saeva]|uniref:Tape measure protein N-terminal domain-containing protein n=1 Tax=Paraburkholderia saeva TaxID=2777537 RepID=A0A9N8RXG2_9BURK|nr:tape measure protein [Paraburkholderia saeva]CAG4901003.1 hypothetical protein LMG31841_02942 [Paraburkholderia saeva]
MADDAERIYKLTVSADQALAELNKISQSAKNTQNSMASFGKEFSGAVSAIKGVAAGLAAAYASIKSVGAIVEASDKIRQLDGSFKALLGSAERAGDMMQQTFDIVRSTGANLDQTASAIQKLSIGMTEMGGSNDQIAQLAENFIKLGTVSGASMDETSRALVQFSQGLAKGKLQGQDFKSILESVPLVAKEIAKQMHVSVGELIEMTSQGKVTSKVMAESLLKATQDINAQFAEIPMTFERSLNIMEADMTDFLSSFDKATGISKTLAEGMQDISKLIAFWKTGLDDASLAMSVLKGTVTVLGAAFKGVVDIVAGFSAILQAALSSVGALAKAAYAIVTGNFSSVTGIFTQWKGEVAGIDANYKKFESTLYDNTATTTKAATAGRQLSGTLKDISTNQDKAAKKTKDHTKALKEQLDVFDQWNKDIFKTAEASDQAATKMAYFEKTLQDLAAAGQEGTTLFKTYSDELEKLRAAADPFEAFRQSAIATQTELDQIPRKLEILFDLLAQGKINGDAFEQLASGLDKANKTAKEGGADLQKWQQAMIDAGNGFISDFVNNIVDGSSAASKSFADMAESMLKTMAKMMLSDVFQRFARAMLSALPGWNSTTPATPQALGGVWQRGVQTYAKGTIITRPTVFPMARGIGLMGEAGPEAVMPLTRTTSGSLGVNAVMAASPVEIIINNNNADQTAVTTTTKDNTDGSRTIEVLMERKVKTMMSDGTMDKTMRNTYGLTRQGH